MLRYCFRIAAAVFLAFGAAPARSAAVQWWTHAVIYEIYLRSFQDTNGDGIGDLNGVTQRLDYLKRLGVDAIWLTPFYPSPNADFGYDVSNYADIAPQYGTMADWDRLVREADKRGIRVLVDLVLNHSSDQHPWFTESRSSVGSARRDWYVWRRGRPGNKPPTNWLSIFGGPAWTLDPATDEWYYHIFMPQQPDLNWGNSKLRAAMHGVVRFWLRHGAGGFRLDATPYLFEDPAFPDDPDPNSGPPAWIKPYNSGRPENHEVLRELRSIVNEFPGDRILLGESATATIEDLAGVYGARHDEINLPMDFLFGNLTQLNAGVFKRQIDDAEQKLGGEPPVFFFSSHDHARQWSSFGDGSHNDQIAKLTAALTLAPRGSALIYYGEEIGMSDMPATELEAAPLGPNRQRADERDKARTPMQWSAARGAGFTTGRPWLPIAGASKRYNVAREKSDPESIYRWYVKLIRLRRENPAFNLGAYVPLESGNRRVLVFAREAVDGAGALVLFNMSDQEEHANIKGWPGARPALKEVLMACPAAAVPKLNEFQIAPYGVLIVSYHR
jgi:alpha-glucosidase